MLLGLNPAGSAAFIPSATLYPNPLGGTEILCQLLLLGCTGIASKLVGALGYEGIIKQLLIEASGVLRSSRSRGSQVPLGAPCPSASIAMVGSMA